MLNPFIDIQINIKNNMNILNRNLSIVIQRYNFIIVTEEYQINEYPEIYENIRSSNVLIVNQYTQSKLQYFIIGFKKVIIIVEKAFLHFLHSLISYNDNLSVYFLFNEKNIFLENIKISLKEIEFIRNFQTELDFFDDVIKTKKVIEEKWKLIKPCMLGYFILESCLKLNQNRLQKFSSDLNHYDYYNAIIDDDEFIELQDIDNSNNSYVKLIYNIKKEELMAIKKYMTNNNESKKLINREIQNYSKIQHPFIPILYGKTKNDYLIMEYIYGSKLSQIKSINLNYSEKITIIFELMIVIGYLHKCNFVYRDLKPNNIIIDQNKMVILIDFDRMIDANTILKNENITVDFAHNFAAPEINSNKVSYKSDIYSLGQLIYFIMNEKMPSKNSNEIDDFEINRIFKRCTKYNPNERPSIIKLIIEFFVYFHEQILIENLFEKYEKYFLEIYDSKTINHLKNIHKNNPETLNFFGDLFFKGQYVSHSINKSFQYYYSAAKLNYPIAFLNLGFIYLNGKYVKQNIKKLFIIFRVLQIKIIVLHHSNLEKFMKIFVIQKTLIKL